MQWLIIVLVSYFILAISSIVDKFFLSKVFTHSLVYVIWVSLMSLVVFVLAPSTQWIGWYWLMVSLMTGAIFTLSLHLLYTALQRGEASRVVPLIGGAMPVIVFLVSWTFNLEDFTPKKIIAFVCLLLGSVLMTIMPGPKNKLTRIKGAYWALGGSLSFAIFFLLTQYIFDHQSFIDGLVWPRVGTALVIVILMLFKNNRHLLLVRFRTLHIKMRLGIISNQALAAAGFLGQNYAIDMGGSLSLITALQGIQYVFILLFAAILTWKFPHMIKEIISQKIIIQKIIALLLIVVGLYYITF